MRLPKRLPTLLPIVLPILLLSLPPTPALAQPAAGTAAASGAEPNGRWVLPASAIAQATALAEEAARAGPGYPPGARLVVSAGLPDPRLQLAACAAITPYLSAGVPVWGKSRVGLRCTQGANWNIQLPITVQVWANAVVAAVALPAGAVLEPSQLTQAVVDWAAFGGMPNGSSLPFSQGDSLQARVLTRPVQAGQPLRLPDLRSRQWFATGDTVQITAVGGGFSISTEGQAMTPGLEGQTARVRTENGRVVTGQAVGQRRLEVKL